MQPDIGKRRYQRIAVDGFRGIIADGNNVVSGIVGNVSSAGLRISRLPVGFSTERKHYIAVVSGCKQHYKIIVRPMWFKADDNGGGCIDVGFKILAAPWEWNEFISATIPDIIG